MEITKTFSNLEGLRQYLDTAPENEVFKGRSCGSKNGTEKFTGTDSYDAANVLLRDGDEKNAAALKAAAAVHVRTLGEGRRNRRYNAVCGGAANVPAALLGLPKTMIRTEKVTYKDSKVLNICYNGTASCDVDKNELKDTAAALMGALMGLEKNGYRVNLYLYFGSQCRDYSRRGRVYDSCNMFVRIKDSGQYLDIKKTAYPLVNPSMLRRHYLRFVETAPGLKNHYFSIGHGSPVTDTGKIETAANNAGLHLKKIVSFYELRGLNTAAIISKLSD